MMIKRMICVALPFMLIIALCACSAANTGVSQPEATVSVEPSPSVAPSTEPVAVIEPDTSAEPTEIFPTVSETEPSQTRVPESTPKASEKPVETPAVQKPDPTKKPETTQAPSPTKKPQETQLAPTVEAPPKPTITPEAPQPTEEPTPAPTDPPAADYTDATGLRSSFMSAINTEKAANGAPEGSLSGSMNSVAQDRARQMAKDCKASHIGGGYSETVGSMGSKGGAGNKGRNSVHHCPDLMNCTSFGIGCAIGSDGLYYYCIIGQ